MKLLHELINDPKAFIHNDIMMHWLDEEYEIKHDDYDITGDDCDSSGEEDNDN